MRNVRRHVRQELEALEKDGDISQDELDRIEKDLEKLTHTIIAEIDDMLGHKEQELLEELIVAVASSGFAVPVGKPPPPRSDRRPRELGLRGWRSAELTPRSAGRRDTRPRGGKGLAWSRTGRGAVSDWRNDHERDSLSFEDEEQAVPRGEAEGVRVLGPDDDESTRPTPRPVPRRGQRAVDDSEEFWGERATDFRVRSGPDVVCFVARSDGVRVRAESESESESKPRSRRAKRAARRAKTATPPPESRAAAGAAPGRERPGTPPALDRAADGRGADCRLRRAARHRAGRGARPWKSASGQSPRYRVEDSDWAEGDFSSPELLKDDSLALGALRGSRPSRR